MFLIDALVLESKADSGPNFVLFSLPVASQSEAGFWYTTFSPNIPLTTSGAGLIDKRAKDG
jgi:hypothetical protein